MKNVIKYLYVLCLFAGAMAQGSQAAEKFDAVAPVASISKDTPKLVSAATALKPLDLSVLSDAKSACEDIVSFYSDEDTTDFDKLALEEAVKQERIDAARLKMEEAASLVILEHAQRCAKLVGGTKAATNTSFVADDALLLQKSGLLRQSLESTLKKHWPKDLELLDQSIEKSVQFYLNLGKGATHTTYNVELAMRKYRSTLTDYLAAMHK